MTRTLQKNIRVTPEQWERIENAAKERDASANRLVVELAMEALDRREWPRAGLEIQLLRSSMFTAQAIARDMKKAGRESEIDEISRNISEIAPDLPYKTPGLRDWRNQTSASQPPRTMRWSGCSLSDPESRSIEKEPRSGLACRSQRPARRLICPERGQTTSRHDRVQSLGQWQRPLRCGFARPGVERFAPENPGQGNESRFLGFWMTLWLSWRA